MAARRSFLLWSRLALARLNGGVTAPPPAPERARPEGTLIWVIPDRDPEARQGAAQVLRRLAGLRPEIALLVSSAPEEGDMLPDGTFLIAPEWASSPALLRSALTHWRPDMIVLTGAQLPTVLIGEASDMGIPILSIDMVAPAQTTDEGFLERRLLRALLSRLARISARTPETAERLLQFGIEADRIEIGGTLSEPPEPLHCSEAERASIAASTRTRPVWLAAAVPEGEFEAVLSAHARAQRHAHRLLLILAPDQPALCAGWASALADRGWTVARRSVEAEPDAETQIFLADEPGEYGLWYRIAPMAYMGGTLNGAAGQARSPIEAATLGSAILHGPQTAPYSADYSRLDAARAARMVAGEAALGDAVADLMAADRAAMLAHNAWAVTSGGAGAAEALARTILAELDARPRILSPVTAEA